MMKPTLTVEGKKHNIISVRVENSETGEEQTFWAESQFNYMDEKQKADFAKAIENPNEQHRLLERLENTLEESIDYLVGLKLDLADKVIENLELPFPNVTLKSDVEEIKSQVSFIEGLEHAIEIAKGKYSSSEVSEVSSTDGEPT